MFVVDKRATGDEIVRISTGLSEYRILADRPGTGEVEGSLVFSLVRFVRNVNALDKDDMAIPPSNNVSIASSWISTPVSNTESVKAERL